MPGWEDPRWSGGKNTSENRQYGCHYARILAQTYTDSTYVALIFSFYLSVFFSPLTKATGPSASDSDLSIPLTLSVLRYIRVFFYTQSSPLSPIWLVDYICEGFLRSLSLSTLLPPPRGPLPPSFLCCEKRLPPWGPARCILKKTLCPCSVIIIIIFWQRRRKKDREIRDFFFIIVVIIFIITRDVTRCVYIINFY